MLTSSSTRCPRFQNAYARLVHWAVNGSGWRQTGVMVGMLALLVLSFVAVAIRKPSVGFFPKGDPKFIYTYLQMPVGTAVEVTDSVTKILENRVYGVIGHNNPDVESVITNVAIGANDPQEQTGAAQSHLGKVAVAFKELSERTGPKTGTYMTKIREVVKGIPGAEVTVDQESSGPPQQKEIAIEVSGDDYQVLAALSKKVFHYVDSLQVPGVERLHSNLEDANPEIAVRVDRERANREGISTAQVGLLARTAIFGRESSKFKTADDDYDIQVRYADKYRKNVDALMDAPITFRTNRGTLRQVPISAVADLKYGTTFGAIKRKNLKKIITISSNVLTSQGYTGADVVPKIAQAVAQIKIPDGYTVKMGGAAEDQKETSDFLGGGPHRGPIADFPDSRHPVQLLEPTDYHPLRNHLFGHRGIVRLRLHGHDHQHRDDRRGHPGPGRHCGQERHFAHRIYRHPAGAGNAPAGGPGRGWPYPSQPCNSDRDGRHPGPDSAGHWPQRGLLRTLRFRAPALFRGRRKRGVLGAAGLDHYFRPQLRHRRDAAGGAGDVFAE